jgi:anti-sigma B factor antagonist
MTDPIVVVPVAHARIDYDSAQRFQEQLLAALGDGSAVLIVDFSAVEAISSVGLRALVVAAKKSKAANGKIVVSGLRPLVREVFEISRFDALFPLYESVAAARDALEAG